MPVRCPGIKSTYIYQSNSCSNFKNICRHVLSSKIQSLQIRGIAVIIDIAHSTCELFLCEFQEGFYIRIDNLIRIKPLIYFYLYR
jgi:hypothetical protein